MELASRLCNMRRRKQLGSFGYQRLEARQLLAGDVSVSLESGVLNVSGDSLANEVQIVGTATGGATVVATAGTTINNNVAPIVVASGIQHVNVRLNGGNDAVDISGLLLADGLTVDGQDGNDRINIHDLNIRFLDANGGSGNDVLEFHNTYSRRDINIRGQNGDDTVSITAMAADRHFHLDTGNGSDTIAIDNLGVRRSIYLSSGSGDDSVLMTGEVYGYKTKIRLGDGNDSLSVLPQTSGADVTTTFRRRLDVKAGSGNDNVLLGAGVSSDRRTKLNGEAGNDSLETDDSNLNRVRVMRFENRQLSNLNQALDTFYAGLSAAGVDTTPFGTIPADVSAPVLTVTSTELTIAEDSGPVAIDSQLTLTGSEGTEVTGATINLVGNDPARDVLAFANTGAIDGVFDAATGTITLTGPATLAEYEAALRTVTYDDLNNTSVAGKRQIEFSVTSDAGAATASRTLNVEGLAAPTFSVNDTPLQLDRSATATEVDDQIVLSGDGFNVIGATIRVVDNVANEDTLAFSTTAEISGVFDSASGVLALTGTASLSEYQAALRTITYDNTNSTFAGTKSIEFSIVTERGSVQDSREVQILTSVQAIESFAAANDLQLQQTASGLHYIIETPGNDVRPTADDSVRVKYRGTLLDGTQFDANDNATFPLDGVIPGFGEGLLLFSEGAVGQLLIPSELAYGESGTTNIPPNSILRFELEVLEVISAA